MIGNPNHDDVDCNSQSSGNGQSPTNPCSTILCALSQCKGSNNDYIIYTYIHMSVLYKKHIQWV